MSDTRITKSDFFTAISDFFESVPVLMDVTLPDFAEDFDDFAEKVLGFCAAEKALLARKSNTGSGPTANQILNAALQERIANEVLTDVGMTATDVSKAIGENVQKATAMLKQMVEAGTAVRDDSGKSALFTLPL